MARKNKRSQLRKPQRGGSGAGRAARPAGIPPLAPAQPGQPAAAEPTPPAASAALPVQRPLPRAARGRQAGGPLPVQDAAIPLDRVPYFRADLRRIAITAGLMFLPLIAGSIVLRGLLQAGCFSRKQESSSRNRSGTKALTTSQEVCVLDKRSPREAAPIV